MYSACMFCHRPLGANQVIEPFPVGRRLAFDARKGRLWVVCRKCERWNLSPFEERWEAVEECERQFREARKRVASENIGLARLDEGLELVRIGEPLRPEFAAWRYGDQFGRRRRNNMLLVGGGIVAVGAVAVGGIATGAFAGGGYGIYQLFEAVANIYRARRVVARIPLRDGRRYTVRGRDLKGVYLSPGSEPGTGWSLHLPPLGGTQSAQAAEGNIDGLFRLLAEGASAPPPPQPVRLDDHEAMHAMALLMPRINAAGGNKTQVQDAVRRIEDRGDPSVFLGWAAVESKTLSRLRTAGGPGTKGAGMLATLPLSTRLAIEMAVHEEAERNALEGELALLELAWKDAEEIAAIADTLALPWGVEEQFDRIKRQAGRPDEPGTA